MDNHDATHRLSELLPTFPVQGMSFIPIYLPDELYEVTAFVIKDSREVINKLHSHVHIDTKLWLMPQNDMYLLVCCTKLDGYLYETWFFPPYDEGTIHCLENLINQKYFHFLIYEDGFYDKTARNIAMPITKNAKEVFSIAFNYYKFSARYNPEEYNLAREAAYRRFPSIYDLWNYIQTLEADQFLKRLED